MYRKVLSCFCAPCLAPSQNLAVSVAANGEVKVLIRPLIVEQSNGMRLQEPSDSDTSSESDIEEITDICDMREIISRMDDDDDGDHDKYDSGMHSFALKCGLQFVAHCHSGSAGLAGSLALQCQHIATASFIHHLTGASPAMVLQAYVSHK